MSPTCTWMVLIHQNEPRITILHVDSKICWPLTYSWQMVDNKKLIQSGAI